MCNQPLFTLYLRFGRFTFVRHNIIADNLATSFRAIILCNQPLFTLYLRFVRFYEDFTLPFTLSLTIPFTSIPFTLSLSYLSPSLYLSFYLSFSPSLSLLSIILFGVSYGRFRPCFHTFLQIPPRRI